MSEEFKFVIDTLKMVWSGCKWIFRCIMALFGFGKKSGLYDKGKKETVGKIILKFFIFEIIVVLVGQFFLLYRLNNVYFVLIYIPFIYLIVKLATRKKHNAKIDEATPAVATFPIESVTPHGVIFGRRNSLYIIKPEELDGHILVVGGVGSGKSSCIAIPTLRNWQDSVFAIDIKGELYEKTKEYHPNIKVFSPIDPNSYGYDPYFCLKTSHNPAQEARAIAQAIIPLPPDIKDPFWIESAQNIFTAAILHYSGQNLSFIDTIKQIQGNTPRTLINELCDSPELDVKYLITSLADMEDKTLSSIMAELSKNIVHFVTDKNLTSALSRANNITPDDLEYGESIYINIPEHLLRQWKNLLTLIVNQFLTHFEQRSETNARPILFLLDEFPRLGKVSAMLDGLATLRSKKIAICLIIQSLAQLDTIYGERERKVISDTCQYKAVLGASDADTQEYFSRLAGTYDKITTSNSVSREAYTGLNKGTSTNTSEVEKRIIKPHEFGMLTDIVLFTPPPCSFPLEKTEANTNVFVPFCYVRKTRYDDLCFLSGTIPINAVEQQEIQQPAEIVTTGKTNKSLILKPIINAIFFIILVGLGFFAVKIVKDNFFTDDKIPATTEQITAYTSEFVEGWAAPAPEGTAVTAPPPSEGDFAPVAYSVTGNGRLTAYDLDLIGRYLAGENTLSDIQKGIAANKMTGNIDFYVTGYIYSELSNPVNFAKMDAQERAVFDEICAKMDKWFPNQWAVFDGVNMRVVY